MPARCIRIAICSCACASRRRSSSEGARLTVRFARPNAAPFYTQVVTGAGRRRRDENRRRRIRAAGLCRSRSGQLLRPHCDPQIPPPQSRSVNRAEQPRTARPSKARHFFRELRKSKSYELENGPLEKPAIQPSPQLCRPCRTIGHESGSRRRGAESQHRSPRAMAGN